jgi:hypothetical protein
MLSSAAPAQLGGEHQEIFEHLPRCRDFGHLKRDVATMAHDLGADLAGRTITNTS